MIQSGLARGLQRAGADSIDLGIVPTPAVAWVSADRSLPAAMISASHNPFHDNGIKLFAAGGLKLRDDLEAQIQKRYLELASTAPASIESNPEYQLDRGASSSIEGWMTTVEGSIDGQQPLDDGRPLDGLKVVLDCANGAASHVGPEIFRRLGADVVAIGCAPDGVNINAGVGSTSPAALAKAVVETSADVGLAFDGDADRLIAVDESGIIVDGDRVIGLLAGDWSSNDRLRDNTVVVTIMTNLGFHRSMAAAGIKVLTTAVGDRYVLEALDDHQLSLGGEQSGHIICRDLATTGDGILAGVQLLDLLARSDQPLGQLSAEVMTTVPQLLENVRLPARDPEAGAAIAQQVAEVDSQFGDDGRVVVRPSGTEPLLRIMVEHIDEDVARQACSHLVAEANKVFGTAEGRRGG